MYRSNAPVNYVLINAVLPLALFTVLSASLAVAQGQNNFFVPPVYAGTGNLFVADFNGDGKPDLLSVDGTLQLGNGDGTFTTGTPVAGTPLAVADFNGDGKPDVLEEGTFSLLVLLGNGDGTFQPPITTNTNAALTAIAAGDLNGDGKADVVGIFNNSLLVYLSNGDGTFAAGVPYSVPISPSANPIITLGDFNGHRRTDLAVSVPGQELVLLGNGDGTFQPVISSTGAAYPTEVVAGDFNGDGKLDLAISNQTEPPFGISVLLGDGNGTFQAPTLVIPGNFGNFAVADLNGDGKLDLVLENFPWLQIYLGNGSGAFTTTHGYYLNFSFSNYSTYPAVADFNLDGKPDIAAGNYLMLGNGNGTFQGLAALPLPIADLAPAVAGGFNKHAAPYVAVAPNIGPNAIEILSNDGTGALAVAHTYTLQQTISGLATAD